MAKFTKLNIGDSVASGGGRAWKKLSAESAEPEDTSIVGTWVFNSVVSNPAVSSVVPVIYSDTSSSEYLWKFNNSNSYRLRCNAIFENSGVYCGVVFRANGTETHRYSSWGTSSYASYAGKTLEIYEAINNVTVDDLFISWLKANATKTA